MKTTWKSTLETAIRLLIAGLALDGDEVATNVLIAYAWFAVFIVFWLSLVIAHESPAADKLRALLAKDDRPQWLRIAGRVSGLLCAAALAAAGSIATAVLFAIAIVISIGCEAYARERTGNAA